MMKTLHSRARARSKKHVGDPRVGRIVEIVRASTAMDLGAYKPSAVQRSVARRMRVRRDASLDRYLGVLAERPDECARLARAVHVGVTSFFRDRAAFEALRDALRVRLLASAADAPVRAWCPACATGEEAYSLAILLRELLDEIGSSAPVRVFASDIDASAIARARAGVYPRSVAAAVGRRRLRRWFVRTGSSYTVGPTVRNTMLFVQQDVLRHPPFSRLDLVSCRNLLIYLRPEAQANLLETIRRALRPDGLLLLGASETLPDDAGFAEVDRRWRLFRRADSPADAPTWGSTSKRRVEREALARANDDLQNLSELVDLAAIFVDRHLVVRRFTDRARHLMDLTAAHVGAPLAELGEALARPMIAEDARRVLLTHVASEVEAERGSGPPLAMRIHPYRTADGDVDGVVVALFDDERRRAAAADERRLTAALRQSPTTVLMTSRDRRILWACGRLFAGAAAPLVGGALHDVLPRADADALAALASAALASGRAERRQLALTIHGQTTPVHVHVHVSAPDSDAEPELCWVATELE